MSSATVAMPGLTMGRITRVRVEYSPEPSMVAASMRSKGTEVWKKVRMMMILKGFTSMGTISAA